MVGLTLFWSESIYVFLIEKLFSPLFSEKLNMLRAISETVPAFLENPFLSLHRKQNLLELQFQLLICV